MHSIHYLDLILGFLGDPRGVHAKTIGHPSSDMAQTRATAILDYGDDVRAAMSINHNHAFGRKHQVAELQFDGTEGGAHATLDLPLDYPRGDRDELWIRGKGETEWVEVPLRGSWFPDAFIGRMANLQRFCAGDDAHLIASVEDAWTTTALIEAAFDFEREAGDPAQGTSLTEIKERYFEDFEIGGNRRTLGRTITEADIVAHAGQTGRRQTGPGG